MTTEIQNFTKEIDLVLSDTQTQTALLTTTFKGLQLPAMKQALMEGRMRGFEFEDFLKKNVYAIPFAGGYSLVTSIDYSRKIGMRSGIVGKKAPEYGVDDDGKIVSCSITVQRMVNGYVGDFTAKVSFDEYYKTGHNGKPSLWDTKPQTMIAKVAEMHALRMACPEELSQAYLEEEFAKGESVKEIPSVDIEGYKAQLEACMTLEELKKVWPSLPILVKTELEGLKNELKTKLR